MKKILPLFLLLLTLLIDVQAQQRTVTGKITSADDGAPIPGVNITVKGTTSGTISDASGNYSINVDAGGALIFSFIGYTSQEVAVGSNSVIDVSLQLDVTQLNEVVVTAIGLEANKRDLGYSIQNVNADEVRQSGETNLVSALSGKAAGVQVISSAGTPGASAQIRIRGNKSVQGSNSPLFVVDGIPIDNSSFTTADSPEDAVANRGAGGVTNSNRAIDVNPDDIANITILKGPAATALYGIRAANGAVIITTKRGVAGAPKVTFSTAYSFDQVNRLPDRQFLYAQGVNSGGGPGNGVPLYRGPETYSGTSWGPLISSLEYDGDTSYPYDRNGALVPAGTGNGVPARAFKNAEDFFQTAHTWNTHLGFSGGNESMNYYGSVGRLFQTGIVPNTEFERITTKATIQANLTDKLKVGFSGSYITSGGIRAQQGSNLSGVMLGLMRTAPTFDINNGHGKDGHKFKDSYEFENGWPRSYRGNLPGGDAIYDNPLWTVQKNYMDDNVNRIIGYTTIMYDLTSWLKASYKIGIDTYSDERKLRTDVHSGNFGPGNVIEHTINNRDVNSDFLLIINKDLSTKLHLDATLGHNYYNHRTFNYRTDGKGLASPGFFNLASATVLSTTELVSKRQLFGAFGDIKLNYADQVFIGLTGRNDWSSTLPESNNSFFYPAASLGWSFTETLGLSENKILPYGKLRVSWGQVGNDAPFSLVENKYTQSRIVDGWTTPNGVLFPAFGVNGFQPYSILGNPDLKAERTSTLELGADLRLLQGKITVDFTYYKATTEDNILVVDIPYSGGWSQKAINSGEIENKGVELALTGTPIQSNDFTWEVGLNFTKYKTTVVSMAPGLPFITIDPFGTQRLAEGQPYGIFYGTRFLRDDEGRVVIGQNGIPLQNPNDGIVGNPTPDWFAGFRNTLSYKGLSLGIFVDIRKGGDVWNGTKGVLNNFGVGGQTADRDDVVVFDGVLVADDGVTPTDEINTIPVVKGGTDGGVNFYQNYGFTGLDETNVEDGSYVRLREVSLTYRFSKGFLSNIKFIKDADIRLYGRNLLLITDYTGIDPETNLTGDASNVMGYDYFNNPNTRSYGISLNVTF